MNKRVVWIAVSLWLACGSKAYAAEIRYPEVMYLDEYDQPPLRLKVLGRIPLAFSRDPRTAMAYLAKGQVVTVLGIGDTWHYVGTRIATGPARGWVKTTALEPPPQKLLEKLRKQRDRREAHRKLIEQHEVAVGMTREEVYASLGKPDRKSRYRTKGTEEEHWQYIIYRYLPFYDFYRDNYGKLRQSVSYRRVPAGHTVVAFRDNEVVALAEQKDLKPRAEAPTFVPYRPDAKP